MNGEGVGVWGCVGGGGGHTLLSYSLKVIINFIRNLNLHG